MQLETFGMLRGTQVDGSNAVVKFSSQPRVPGDFPGPRESGPSDAPAYQFGDFTVDRGRFELRYKDQSIRLERKPLQLLILLASRGGSLVTRDEITEKLWGRDVFIDSEHGINTAIRKIRAALKDDPDDPQFIKTVTGMGYRFVARIHVVLPVRQIESPDLPTSPRSLAQERTRPTFKSAQVAEPVSERARLIRIAAGLIGIALSLVIWFSSRVHPLTHTTQMPPYASNPARSMLQAQSGKESVWPRSSEDRVATLVFGACAAL